MSEEKVLVINEGRMEGIENLPGLATSNEDLSKFIDMLPYSEYMDRDKAEEDTTYKQVIPYTVIRHQGKLLVYKRTKEGGEGRLHDKYSIGIGGHINPTDGIAGESAFLGAFIRELDEELSFGDLQEDDFSVETFGVLYDPSNDVGKVHLGCVVLVDLLDKIEELPVANENCVSDLQWLTVDEIKKLDNLENWSKIVLERL